MKNDARVVAVMRTVLEAAAAGDEEHLAYLAQVARAPRGSELIALLLEIVDLWDRTCPLLEEKLVLKAVAHGVDPGKAFAALRNSSFQREAGRVQRSPQSWYTFRAAVRNTASRCAYGRDGVHVLVSEVRGKMCLAGVPEARDTTRFKKLLVDAQAQEDSILVGRIPAGTPGVSPEDIAASWCGDPPGFNAVIAAYIPGLGSAPTAPRDDDDEGEGQRRCRPRYGAQRQERPPDTLAGSPAPKEDEGPPLQDMASPLYLKCMETANTSFLSWFDGVTGVFLGRLGEQRAWPEQYHDLIQWLTGWIGNYADIRFSDDTPDAFLLRSRRRLADKFPRAPQTPVVYGGPFRWRVAWAHLFGVSSILGGPHIPSLATPDFAPDQLFPVPQIRDDSGFLWKSREEACQARACVARLFAGWCGELPSAAPPPAAGFAIQAASAAPTHPSPRKGW